MRSFFIKALFVALTPLTVSPALAEFVDGGLIMVEENIANPKYPTHMVAIIGSEYKGGGPDLVNIRCRDNSTEVFVNTDGIYGRNGTVKVRWPGMSSAKRIPSSTSNSGDAAFIENPIGFITRLAAEREVVIQVRGYSTSGAVQYKLTDPILDAIYDLAETCEWVARLPDRKTAPQQNKSEPTAHRADEIQLVRSTLPAVRELGKDKFIEILDELLSKDS